MTSSTMPLLRVMEARDEAVRLKLGEETPGWSPRLRQRFGYFTPDEWYEAALLSLVGPETEWLDVGCGHDPFPSNRRLARVLADRAKLLVGLDPSDNIARNEFVHERYQCLLEAFPDQRQFDLISMRMVAEHITDPAAAVGALGRLCRSGGRVVVYTVSKWSPASLMAALTPMAVHHAAKKVLWRTEPEDTFPTAYRLNTRPALRRYFGEAGFAEESFVYLDDCRALARWKLTSALELSLQKMLKGLGLRYPELCLIGIYRKQ